MMFEPNEARESQYAVSVIVPAYNSERTLLRCLRSLEHQTLGAIELIVVDDGSVDRTLSIAKRFSTDSSTRVVVLHERNGGPSSARNLGLDAARGEYIAFVDSDDEVDSHYLEKMYAKAVEYDADIVSCGRTSYDYSTHEEVSTKIPAYDVIYGGLLEAPQIAKRVGPLMCDKLFRRSIIVDNNIRFAADLFHAEDYLFTSTYRLYVRCVAAVRESLYHYYLHSGVSISSSNSHVLDIPVACRRIVELYKSHGVFDATSQYLLFVMMGYYLRKRKELPRGSQLRKAFIRDFKSLFRTSFPDSWVDMFRHRSVRMLKAEGLRAFLKVL